MGEAGMDHLVVWPLRNEDREAALVAADAVGKRLDGALNGLDIIVSDDALRVEISPSLFPEFDSKFAAAMGRAGVEALKVSVGTSGGEGYKVLPLPPRERAR